MELPFKISKRAFWDINFEDVDWEKHQAFIIRRIFERGKWADVINVIQFYGIDKTKIALVNSEHLSENAFQLASAMFNIDKKKFKCYTQKQYTLSYWKHSKI